MQLYTIGHSNRSAEQMIALLRQSGIRQLADVRSFPASRRNPQFNAGAFADDLRAAGIAYHHLKALGGRRSAQDLGGRPSRNGYWREEAFRHYADYAMGGDFRGGIERLLALAGEGATAIMCAEADWRSCHRQIVADYLLAAGHELTHILGPNRQEPAAMNPAAEPQPDGRLHYPPRQGSLF